MLDGQGARADAGEAGSAHGLPAADTEGEPSALLQYSKFSYTAGAKISLKTLADELVQACKTKVEDRAKLRRSFPVEFIALPWESDLNEKAKEMLK